MEYQKEYFFCSSKLLQNVDEINEIHSCIDNIKWKKDYSITLEGKRYEHQRAYNKSFQLEFSTYGWKSNPRLCDSPD